jgi:hypothetical protein
MLTAEKKDMTSPAPTARAGDAFILGETPTDYDSAETTYAFILVDRHRNCLPLPDPTPLKVQGCEPHLRK